MREIQRISTYTHTHTHRGSEHSADEKFDFDYTHQKNVAGVTMYPLHCSSMFMFGCFVAIVYILIVDANAYDIEVYQFTYFEPLNANQWN